MPIGPHGGNEERYLDEFVEVLLINLATKPRASKRKMLTSKFIRFTRFTRMLV